VKKRDKTGQERDPLREAVKRGRREGD